MNNKNSLKGRKVIITGGSSGIGRAAARYVAFGVATLLCGLLLYALVVMLALQAYQRELDFVIR